mgnify:CR=1 FL=1
MKLSILMPVYNEEGRIADALKQALAVDYPCEIELVVVDDGSRDGTGEILGRVDDLADIAGGSAQYPGAGASPRNSS